MQLPKVALLTLVGTTGCGATVERSEPGPTEQSVAGRTPARPIVTTGSESASATAPDPSPTLLAVDENLARLQALDLFEVGDLVVDMPAEATNCYGTKPCAGSEPAVSAARSAAAERLAQFADTAETAVATPYDAYACGTRIDSNLDAVRALRIVEVGNFIRDQPANNPDCYNLPCPADQAAADAVNEARATDLESVALATSKL